MVSLRLTPKESSIMVAWRGMATSAPIEWRLKLVGGSRQECFCISGAMRTNCKISGSSRDNSKRVEGSLEV